MADTSDCPYLQQVHRNLPRLLALFDRDRLGPTHGLGDRTYWAWKLKDFPNATFQGAASGLSRLLVHGLLPRGFDEATMLARIKAIIEGSKATTAYNGSLAEALPNEGSFCVTALVAADTLIAIQTLDNRLSGQEREAAFAVVAPWISFLYKQDEHHGIISNHLAVAVLALVLWQDLTGKNCGARAKQFLDRILKHRSPEGWFLEYSGADPGYQSWLMSSLTAVDRLRPAWGMRSALHEGANFLTHFAHPDGSYGGLYGSRMTRFCFPAGFEALASRSPSAHAMAIFLRKGVPDHRVVTLDAIDAHNLAPLFNDYVWAAVERATPKARPQPARLPHASSKVYKHFVQAGLLVEGSADHYTVLSLFKGGALLHFHHGKLMKQNPGTVCTAQGKPILTTQFQDEDTQVKIDNDTVVVNAALRPVSRQLPNAFRFIILRLLSLTVFHSIFLGNKVKRALTALLVSSKPKAQGSVRRTITLGADLAINDEITAPAGYASVAAPQFRAIHMASQGYWQASDDVL